MGHDLNNEVSDADLERLFANMRMDDPVPPAALLRRIEADAVRMQPAPPVAQVREVHTRRWWDRLVALGGRFALPSGLVAAGLTGLWIGLSAGGAVGGGTYAVYASELGQRVVFDFPVLAGLLPEG